MQFVEHFVVRAVDVFDAVVDAIKKCLANAVKFSGKRGQILTTSIEEPPGVGVVGRAQ